MRPAWRERLVTAQMSSSEICGALEGGDIRRVSRLVNQSSGESSLMVRARGRARALARGVA